MLRADAEAMDAGAQRDGTTSHPETHVLVLYPKLP
jgi:hypothetical protein